MSHDAPPAIAARRAKVRQYAARGMSARAIAARLGVGKDTVRRDLKALRQAAHDGAAQGAPADAPLADRLTLALDDPLREDLALLGEAGHDPAVAVRLAIAVLARAYRGAWKFGLYPRGVTPRVRCVQFYPYDRQDRR